VVDAVGVVEGEVVIELAAEAGVAGMEVAGEGGPPALLEDQAVERFDMAVGLWPARFDVGDRGFEGGDRLVEWLALEFVAVVPEDALEPPARPLEVTGDAAGELGGLGGGGIVVAADDEFGPGVGGVAVDRGCQTAPWAPFKRPT
jgi:hypothetical protein